MIPDAPWIRDAETNGYPADDPVLCPVCGEECETVYMVDDEVVGCDQCVTEKDAADWYRDKIEAEREDYEEHKWIDE